VDALLPLLRDLPRSDDPALLVGPETADDAAVYRLSDDIALVQTVDFFTPIVDDPYDFGRIAAANALSDVYAMGGRPVTALNLVAFPLERLGGEVLREILRGGHDVVAAAGAGVVGGHSIDDPEPKYGLAVTGVVHPDAVPAIDGVEALLADDGAVSGGSRRNAAYADGFTTFGAGVAAWRQRLLADATTSGGLLVALPAERAAEVPGAVVGRLVDGPAGRISVR
jgi:selenophosphate synthase